MEESIIQEFKEQKLKAKKIFTIKEIAKNVAYEFVRKYHYLGDANMEKEELDKAKCIQYINKHKAYCCDYCGGKLSPIYTEDNSGNPTYWVGCEKCQRFTYGVEKQTYEIAKQLVDDGGIYYHHTVDYICDARKNNDTELLEYLKRENISGFCDLINKIDNIKKTL